MFTKNLDWIVIQNSSGSRFIDFLIENNSWIWSNKSKIQ